jgi:hypothetical protein
MGKRHHPGIHAATGPRCGLEFGNDNLVLDRTMARALTRRRPMAQNSLPG